MGESCERRRSEMGALEFLFSVFLNSYIRRPIFGVGGKTLILINKQILSTFHTFLSNKI